MAGPNIGSSVVRRDSRSASRVINELQSQGWRRTGSIGDRVTYMESAGFSLTVIDGPAGSVVIPSGPIRGRVFGSSGLEVSSDSLMGMNFGNGGRGFNFGSRLRNFQSGVDLRNKLPDLFGRSTSSTSSTSSSSTNDDDSAGEVTPPGRKERTESSGTGDFV